MKITEKAIRDALHPAVSDLHFSQWDKQRMVQVAMASVRQQKRPALKQVGRVALALVCMMAVSLASTAVVLASPSLSAKLSWLGRQTRRYLTPVMASSTCDGIEMEVLASMQDEETVVAYLSFSDKEGRLADTLELPDVMIDGAPTVITGTPAPQPDGSVVVRVQGLRDPMQALGGRVSISLSTILSGEEDAGFVPAGFTLADVESWNPNPKMGGRLPVSGVDLVGNGSLYHLTEQETMHILKPITQYVDRRIPFMEFQSAGILDGSLHILALRDRNLWYNHCMLALYDANGNPVAEDSAQVNLGPERKSENGRSENQVVEFILDIPESTPLDQLSVYYRTQTYENCITGQWEVNFNVDKTPRKMVQVPCEVDLDSWTMTSIKVSPFGVVTGGSGVLLEDTHMPEVKLYLSDGTVLDQFSSAITSVQTGANGQPDQISSKKYFDQPLELDMLERIEVNSTAVWTK